MNYTSSVDIYGFQFSHDGCGATGAAGSDSETAGFTVSPGADAVMGFSFTGSFIPAGSGTLVTGTTCESVSGLIVAINPGGDPATVELGSYGDEVACDDVDADGTCDDVDDCVGSLDLCGVCNGDDSSCEDCAGVPNGDAQELACGCNDATSCLGCDGVANSGLVNEA